MRFELDCASTMFVLGQTKRRRYIIRMSVILNDTVDECVLQKALERTAKIYPYFFVEFISKFGQLYAGPVADLPPVREKLIKNYIPMKSKDEKWEAMVSYNDKTIYLEYFHAVSDGKGGSEFFKTMIANYLAMKYDVSIINSIKPLSIADQTVNGYKMSAEGIASQKKSGIAYRIKGTKNPCGLINVTSFLLSVDEIKKKSMEYQVSITEFLSAVLCLAIWNIQQEKRAFIQKKIRLTIPVNLRERLSCQTMRNFTLSVYPEINPRSEEYDLKSICEKFHNYMKQTTTNRELAGRCAVSNAVAGLPIMCILPMFLKKSLVQFSLNFPSTSSCLTFSNLGRLVLPDEIKSHIKDFEIMFSAKPGSPYTCTMFSLDNRMKLTFLRSINEPYLETQFEKVLCDLGIGFGKI